MILALAMAAMDRKALYLPKQITYYYTDLCKYQEGIIMSDKAIWIVFTKSKILIDSSLAMDGSEFAFGEVFVPSEGFEDAISRLENVMNKAKQALLEDSLVLSDISKCMRYEKAEWSDDSEFSKEIKMAAGAAIKSNKISFSTFRSSDSLELED